MVTLESTLNDFMKLDYNTREMLLEIMQKRQIEVRRKEIAKAAKHSLKDYREGKFKAETANELISRLSAL